MESGSQLKHSLLRSEDICTTEIVSASISHKEQVGKKVFFKELKRKKKIIISMIFTGKKSDS